MLANEGWKHDEAIRAALEAWADSNGLTHAEVAGKLRFTATRVTKYLNLNRPGNAPEPDAPRVETAARNLLRHLSRRAALKLSLFDTSATASVRTVLRQIRKTGDVGLIYSEAGVGKTCGAELYCNTHPNSLLITATRYRRNATSVDAMLYDELAATEGRKAGGQRRAVWMENLLRGSERMILVDNAHKLAFSGLEFLFDFHDATFCSIALIGNPEVLNLVRGNDQLFSRIGIVRKIKIANDEGIVATRMIEQLCPGAECLAEAAADIVARLGHVRTLKKQLLLARDIKESTKKDWAGAFEMAGAMLIKPGQASGRNGETAKRGDGETGKEDA